MSCPDYWSGWPILPVKRSTGEAMPEVGVMLCYPIGSTTVYATNMFLVPERGTLGALHTKLESGPKHVYKDLDELLGDGWRVD